tara:strand:+ start:252 stop:530 length:279 start_codon:yes stop_codon:yes gene_type:complete
MQNLQNYAKQLIEIADAAELDYNALDRLTVKLQQMLETESADAANFAIVNFTNNTTEFYTDFTEASNAIAAYNVRADNVFVASAIDNALERL